MNVEILEARLKALEDQVAKTEKLKSEMSTLKKLVKSQENRIQTLQDTEEIKTLQKAYGYYLEYWMPEEVIDCFADGPDVSLKLYEGTWLGKDGIRRYFDRGQPPNPESMHQVMQLSGIVTVEPGNQSAKGRWYSWGAVALPIGGGVRQFFMNGIYESEYIKQGGKWKINKLQYNLNYSAPPAAGWVSPERVAAIDPTTPMKPLVPDAPPANFDTKYPSGYIFPFHFKHPVTGKATSEAKRNAKLKLKPNRFAQKK